MMVRFPWWRRGAATPPITDIVASFESLGDNCEFGLVQRYCGAEPLGLLRFSSTGLDALIEALDTDFRHYGSAGDLEILPNPQGFLGCRSRRYGFGYATSDPAETSDAATALRRETARVGYLKRKLLEELAAGEKVFVRKGPPGEGLDEAQRLATALRRHGTCQLLHVQATGEATRPAIHRHDDTLIVGSIPRFAAAETAYDLDLESWIELCVSAYRLRHGTSVGERPTGVSRNHLPRRSRRDGLHVLAGAARAPEVFGALQATSVLVPRAIHAYSAWVWIPAGFEGERIGAAIGDARLGWRDADLSRRECWQRVWVASRLPDSVRVLMMGLVASGKPGSRFWSSDRCLEPGPAPSAAAPPRRTPTPDR